MSKLFILHVSAVRSLAIPVLAALLIACAEEHSSINGDQADGNSVLNAPATESRGLPNGATSEADKLNGAAPADEQKASGPIAADELRGISLRAAPAVAAPGETLTLTLSNGSSQKVGYNLCTSDLETRSGRRMPSNRVCTMELRLLDPGRSATYPYELPARVEPGSYRLVASVNPVGADMGLVVTSNSFEVRRD